MVFIVGQALVDLGSGELREAVHRQSVDCFAVVEEADDIVDADSGAFHDRVATPHPCQADDIAVGFRSRFHALMLRFACPSVNADHAATPTTLPGALRRGAPEPGLPLPEREYSELLTVLIEAFEDAHCDLEGSTPGSRLRGLMEEERGLRRCDLLGVFGSRGIASEVVSGKRAISKAQAKKLAQLFHVPADLFL